ncbi:DNA-binding protein [Paenibacillus sp. FSL R7-0048]|uniref:DNA-binding protein n=2 Tax=Paenibacillus odorifer TaxID=189426 RepID=A0A1R0Z3P8_9BACL|nr:MULTISPECIES: DNA-binding protein [Paenibacillus]AWV36220.1 DNA-binding protein [Paenibacillus odorifer]MDH6428796.1 tetratricopeptide (TPR) repeat protein [Paenibacillus sp. PastH-4]MDH6444998.1 tetratricopeptide (TPR) repeat protein [Paenibacillus sp. PastF-4]MDH6528891.1 tetratricopeptide (TPR) repeat protein [Paenibacillus sp. PastH-3]OMC65747.1 DNA-binding protein [Paenibacillus odorifer]
MEGKLTTIRSEIEKNLSRSGHNLASFSKICGLNRGSLSAILHGNPPKPMSLGQVDAIIKAFGFPEGWLYPLYVDECFNDEKVSRRRVEPFLIRCAELGKQNCIDETISRLLESTKPLDIIYSVADKLFNKGKVQESMFFYKIVVENESDSYSERLAISHYRNFKFLQTLDMEEKLRAVISFSPFRGRLPENLQLDGLLMLTQLCFALRRWEEMEIYADELRALANAVYRQELRRSGDKRREELCTERPLVVYYGHGYLLKAISLTKQGQYEAAKKYTAGYADLGWFEMLDEVGQQAVEQFRLFAVGNSFTLEMLEGNVKVVPDYVAFLAEHPGEILPGLIIIMESANHYRFSVDDVLKRFAREMLRFEQFEDPINIDRLYRLYYQIAMYLINNGQYITGVDYIIQSLELSIKTNNGIDFIKCVTLFETNRDYATLNQQEKYRKLIREVRKDEKITIDDGRHFSIV